MSSSLLHDPAASALFIVCVVTAPLCVLAAALRFVATRRVRRSHSSEDWCAYGAVVILLVYISVALKAITFIDGRQVLTIPPDELLYIGKLYYAVPPLFIVNQLLTKLSVLLFYHRTFGIYRAFRYGVYIVGSLVAAWCVAVLPIFLFSCRPISKGWNLMEPGTCLDYATSVASAESINVVLDFVMVIQAWIMIRPLKVSTSTKFKLGVLFAAGTLAGAAGIAKIFETYRTVGGGINYMTGLWAIVQMVGSIFCCCVITYKPILPKGDLLSRIAGRVRRSVTPTKSNKSQGSAGIKISGPSLGSSWVKLSEAGQKTSIWAETASVQSETPLRTLLAPPPNTISVKRSVEIV